MKLVGTIPPARPETPLVSDDFDYPAFGSLPRHQGGE
jgi:hypothetical protein